MKIFNTISTIAKTGRKTVIASIFTALAALFCIQPATAAPFYKPIRHKPLYEIDIEAGSRLIYSPSFELFSNRPSLGAIQARAAYLPGIHNEKLSLDLRLGFATSAADSFQSIESRLNTWTAVLGTAGQLPLADFIHLQARGALGIEYVHVIINDSSAPDLRGGSFVPVLEATGGILLTGPERGGGSGETIYFRIESGYGWRPFSAEIKNLERKVDDDEEYPGIERGKINLGKVGLSGTLIRFALGFRF